VVRKAHPLVCHAQVCATVGRCTCHWLEVLHAIMRVLYVRVTGITRARFISSRTVQRVGRRQQLLSGSSGAWRIPMDRALLIHTARR
jgi:hypothetical protein